MGVDVADKHFPVFFHRRLDDGSGFNAGIVGIVRTPGN